jgi:hypothetical protein
MSFWNNPDIELKIKSRFLVSIADGFFLPNVKSVSKPSADIGTKSYKLINHEFNYPGTVKWNPISITFVDMNGNSNGFDTGGFFAQMLNNSGYDYPDSSSHNLATKGSYSRKISSPEKSSTIANAFGPGIHGKADFTRANYYEQNVIIYQLTPDGDINEVWTLVNPLIKSIKLGELSYDSDDAVEYTLEVAYDWAKYG